jgi:DNA replication protein DnaC
MPTDELVPVLKKLRLSGVLKTLDLRTREAVDASLSHGEFLLRLCSDEVERREAKQLELRLRRANFETTKRLEDFEWSFNPQIPKAKIIDLATCHFVERRENAILIGPTGVGKRQPAACPSGNGGMRGEGRGHRSDPPAVWPCV